MAKAQGSPEGLSALREQIQKLDRERTILANNIRELQSDSNEHTIVLDAFKGVEPSRRCYRMVGGVLVERTLAEIKPALEEHREKVENAIKSLEEQMNAVQTQLAQCSAEYVRRTGSSEIPHLKEQKQQDGKNAEVALT